MARFLDEMESPIVGSYFDIGNVVRFGFPAQWIRILGKRIGKLDVKEYSRKKQKTEGLYAGFQVEIGEGDSDWPNVRKALTEINYKTGWATAEVKGGDRKTPCGNFTPNEKRSSAQLKLKAASKFEKHYSRTIDFPEK